MKNKIFFPALIIAISILQIAFSAEENIDSMVSEAEGSIKIINLYELEIEASEKVSLVLQLYFVNNITA